MYNAGKVPGQIRIVPFRQDSTEAIRLMFRNKSEAMAVAELILHSVKIGEGELTEVFFPGKLLVEDLETIAIERAVGELKKATNRLDGIAERLEAVTELEPEPEMKLEES